MSTLSIHFFILLKLANEQFEKKQCCHGGISLYLLQDLIKKDLEEVESDRLLS